MVGGGGVLQKGEVQGGRNSVRTRCIGVGEMMFADFERWALKRAGVYGGGGSFGRELPYHR